MARAQRVPCVVRLYKMIGKYIKRSRTRLSAEFKRSTERELSGQWQRPSFTRGILDDSESRTVRLFANIR